MQRFDTRIAAGVLVGLAALYMIVSLAAGRPARSELPPDLSAKAEETGLDLFKAAALLVQHGDQALAVDLRSAEAFARYHLPGVQSLPAASAADLRRRAEGKQALLLLAEKDDEAQARVAEILRQCTASGQAPPFALHFLKGGPRAWYLAFELPVPLFSEKAPPLGWEAAMAQAKAYFAAPSPAAKDAALQALGTLARLAYEPELLHAAGKPKTAGKPKKKIAGGCG